MQQIPFDWSAPARPPAGHRRSVSSREAAKAVDRNQSFKEICYGLILAELRKLGEIGATSRELSESLNIDYDYLQPRTSELKDQNLIMASGARRAWPGKKAADVLVLVRPA